MPTNAKKFELLINSSQCSTIYRLYCHTDHIKQNLSRKGGVKMFIQKSQRQELIYCVEKTKCNKIRCTADIISWFEKKENTVVAALSSEKNDSESKRVENKLVLQVCYWS